jgi:hypothetical protein
VQLLCITMFFIKGGSELADIHWRLTQFRHNAGVWVGILVYCFQNCYDTVRNFPYHKQQSLHEINKVILRVEMIILGWLCFGKVSTVMFQRLIVVYKPTYQFRKVCYEKIYLGITVPPPCIFCSMLVTLNHVSFLVCPLKPVCSYLQCLYVS